MSKFFILIVVIFLMSSCDVFKKQVIHVNDVMVLRNHPCYNDSCNLKNMLELLKLTKSEWSKIKFEDPGVEYLRNYLATQFMTDAKLLMERKYKEGLTEEEIFEQLIRNIFYYMKKYDNNEGGNLLKNALIWTRSKLFESY